MEVRRRLPGSHSFNLLGVHTQTFVGYHEAQESTGVAGEVTLGSLDLQSSLVQGVEHNLHVLNVLLSCLGEHTAVIKVDHNKLVKVRLQYVVHQLHKGRWGASQAEGQYSELVQPVPGAEGSDVLVVRVNSHLVIATPKVKGGEVLGAVELIKEFIDTGERVLVGDGDGVELPVINAHTE